MEKVEWLQMVGKGQPGFTEPAVQISLARFAGINDTNDRSTIGS